MSNGPCRFRWNGDDHTDCPRCGGTNVDPVQLNQPAPTSEEIHAWINLAYRQPPGFGPMDNDGSRFTRWNMEVAFMAGWNAANKGVQNV